MGISALTMRDTVGWETLRRSPRNFCVPFCRRYMQAISTARYSPHDFGRPTFLSHGSFIVFSACWTRQTSSCICVVIRPVVRWYRNGLSSDGIDVVVVTIDLPSGKAVAFTTHQV
jgi:hypothetical protein